MESEDSSDVVEIPPPEGVSNEPTTVLCKVCLCKRSDLVLYPCTHAVICQDCYERIPVPKRCPVCRAFVTRTQFVIIT